VVEVWFWEDDLLAVYVLEAATQRYARREQSACLPDLDLALLCRLSMLDTINDAIAELHAALSA
jgi:hypothetical protein